MAEARLRQVQRGKVSVAPPPEVELEVRQGKKFILVGEYYDAGAIPEGYSLVESTRRGDIFKALVPSELCDSIVNRVKLNSKDPLGDIRNFCEEAEGHENRGKISPQEINLASKADQRYIDHLTMELMRAEKTEGGEKIVFNNERVKHLRLDDPYVEQRLKGIAALALGTNVEEIQKMEEMSQIAFHATDVPYESEVAIPSLVKCECGSHIEVKVQYQVTQVTRTRSLCELDLNASRFEEEIHKYIIEKNGKPLGPDDPNLIRQRINLEYILTKNPSAQLPIIISNDKPEEPKK